MASAARSVAGFKEGSYTTLSTALKIGHSLSECAGMLQAEGIMKGDADQEKAAGDFLALYKGEWKIEVSSRALGTGVERRWNRPDNIPSNADVQRMQATIDKDLNLAERGIVEETSIESCIRLAQVALTAIMLFNRRWPRRHQGFLHIY